MSAMDDGEVIEKYFKTLKEVLDKHALQVYNVDEFGIPLDHRSPHVVVKRGKQKVRYRTSGNKNQVTVVGYIDAAGSAMLPFVTFDVKN